MDDFARYFKGLSHDGASNMAIAPSVVESAPGLSVQACRRAYRQLSHTLPDLNAADLHQLHSFLKTEQLVPRLPTEFPLTTAICASFERALLTHRPAVTAQARDTTEATGKDLSDSQAVPLCLQQLVQYYVVDAVNLALEQALTRSDSELSASVAFFPPCSEPAAAAPVEAIATAAQTALPEPSNGPVVEAVDATEDPDDFVFDADKSDEDPASFDDDAHSFVHEDELAVVLDEKTGVHPGPATAAAANLTPDPQSTPLELVRRITAVVDRFFNSVYLNDHTAWLLSRPPLTVQAQRGAPLWQRMLSVLTSAQRLSTRPAALSSDAQTVCAHLIELLRQKLYYAFRDQMQAHAAAISTLLPNCMVQLLLLDEFDDSSFGVTAAASSSRSSLEIERSKLLAVLLVIQIIPAKYRSQCGSILRVSQSRVSTATQLDAGTAELGAALRFLWRFVDSHIEWFVSRWRALSSEMLAQTAVPTAPAGTLKLTSEHDLFNFLHSINPLCELFSFYVFAEPAVLGSEPARVAGSLRSPLVYTAVTQLTELGVLREVLQLGLSTPSQASYTVPQAASGDVKLFCLPAASSLLGFISDCCAASHSARQLVVHNRDFSAMVQSEKFALLQPLHSVLLFIWLGLRADSADAAGPTVASGSAAAIPKPASASKTSSGMSTGTKIADGKEAKRLAAAKLKVVPLSDGDEQNDVPFHNENASDASCPWHQLAVTAITSLTKCASTDHASSGADSSAAVGLGAFPGLPATKVWSLLQDVVERLNNYAASGTERRSLLFGSSVKVPVLDVLQQLRGRLPDMIASLRLASASPVKSDKRDADADRAAGVASSPPAVTSGSTSELPVPDPNTPSPSGPADVRTMGDTQSERSAAALQHALACLRLLNELFGVSKKKD